MRPEVRFIYLSTKMNQGSTVMRAHQLCRMVAPFLEDRYELKLDAIDVTPNLVPRNIRHAIALNKWVKRQPSDSILFFTKACLKVLDAQTVVALRKRNIRICFDYVDADFRSSADLGPDIHVCSSYAQRDAIAAHQSTTPGFGGTPMLLLHNYDAGLINGPSAQQDVFRCGYIGTPEVGYLPEAVCDQIDVISAKGIERWQRTLETITHYSLHYCLRLPQADNSRIVKPFTKGFVAARLGSPVIVNRQTEDAETMLGTDYPFMVDRLEEKLVLDGMAAAKAAFGGKTWCEAQDRMASVANAVSPQALASQFDAIFKQLDM